MPRSCLSVSIVTLSICLSSPNAFALFIPDVNSDGSANSVDVQLVINNVLGIDIGAFSADINEDSAINAVDIQLVINAVLGIDIQIAPTAGFLADATAVEAPFSVQFTDTSDPGSDAITSWLWNFGDPASGIANTSTDPNPTHTYSAPGAYTVGLTVTNTIGSNATEVTNFITVTLAIEDAASNFVNTAMDVTQAATALEDSYDALVASADIDAARARLDAALVNQMSVASDITTLLERSDLLAGRVYEPPVLSLKKSNTVSPKGVTECGGTTVLYINGMNVPYPAFLDSVNNLALAVLRDPALAGKDIRVRGIYQRSATDAQQSYFGGIICPLLGTTQATLAQEYTAICRAGGGAFIDLAEASTQVINDYSIFPDLVSSQAQTEDIARIATEFATVIAAEKRKLVVVCHSQGNLFTRDAVNALPSDEFGPLADAVGIIEVASPSPLMPLPTFRVDMCQDPVPMISMRFSIFNCHIWDQTTTGLPNINAHSFVSSYLSTQGTTRQFILNQVGSYHDTITNSRSEASKLHVDPIEIQVASTQDEAEVVIAIDENATRDLHWTATTSDERIVIDQSNGTLLAGMETPDSSVLHVTTSNLGTAFFGEITITNLCDESNIAKIRVVVGTGGFVNFDDWTFGSIFDPNFYADRGLVFDTNAALRIATDSEISPPNALCGLLPTLVCGGDVIMRFDPPANTVRFYVGDAETDMREPFTIQVIDPLGGEIQSLTTSEDRRFYSFAAPGIATIHFQASTDWESIDSISWLLDP